MLFSSGDTSFQYRNTKRVIMPLGCSGRSHIMTALLNITSAMLSPFTGPGMSSSVTTRTGGLRGPSPGEV
ncbi:unnamed protein product [Haemonchus placei]|uniref:Uncharacterized protein n=1 Tax=Haemonchus placei TaxID=6290 RepID=A0A158QMC2_HAEPC|nr:unnamed protein product [Haemonchus placei]